MYYCSSNHLPYLGTNCPYIWNKSICSGAWFSRAICSETETCICITRSVQSRYPIYSENWPTNPCWKNMLRQLWFRNASMEYIVFQILVCWPIVSCFRRTFGIDWWKRIDFRGGFGNRIRLSLRESGTMIRKSFGCVWHSGNGSYHGYMDIPNRTYNTVPRVSLWLIYRLRTMFCPYRSSQ